METDNLEIRLRKAERENCALRQMLLVMGKRLVDADPSQEQWVFGLLQESRSEGLTNKPKPVKPVHTVELFEVLAMSQAAAIDGKIAIAIDILGTRLDEEMRAKRFSLIDEVLANVNTDQYHTDVLMTLLTVTLPAKSKLPSRVSFFSKMEGTLTFRSELRPGILDGLL
jgi:hypothetical protein